MSIRTLVAPVAMLTLFAALSPSARAAIVGQQPLNPLAFASSGTLTAPSDSTLTLTTGDGTSTPTLTLTFTPPLANQVTVTLAAGTIADGVAVFDFDSVALPATSTLNVSGSLPLALLSRGAATFNGRVNANAIGQAAGPGGGAGGGTNARGGGPGGGLLAGGSFGGPGGTAGAGGSAGPTYGDPTLAFLGGSGGGGGTDNLGGGGGGAVQISALDDVTIAGLGLGLNGGDANAGTTFGGSGGSGGGLFVASPGTVSIFAPVTATGGAGATAIVGGGGGGGGRILVEAGLFLTPGPAFVSVNGGVGSGGSGGSFLGGNAGGSGTFAVTAYVFPAAVPEPATLATLAATALALARRRRPFGPAAVDARLP